MGYVKSLVTSVWLPHIDASTPLDWSPKVLASRTRRVHAHARLWHCCHRPCADAVKPKPAVARGWKYCITSARFICQQSKQHVTRQMYLMCCLLSHTRTHSPPWLMVPAHQQGTCLLLWTKGRAQQVAWPRDGLQAIWHTNSSKVLYLAPIPKVLMIWGSTDRVTAGSMR